MGYLLTEKTIELINKNLNLKLDKTTKDFNVLIYVFEHYNNLDVNKFSLDFYLLLKFYGHCEYFMILDFIRFLSRKIFSKGENININPFINKTYILLSDIIISNPLTKLDEIFNNYSSLINNTFYDFSIKDYMFIYETYIKK